MKGYLASGALACALLIGFAGPAAAFPIDDVITGADMVGIEVEAFFDGGGETATWASTSEDDAVPNGEGFAGEAMGTGWSLQQQGFTLGNVSGSEILGLWSFNNFSTSTVTIMRFVVRALPGNIVFDTILSGIPFDEGTPGSGQGREFTPVPLSPEVRYSYSDPVNAPDLFGTLNVEFGDNGFAPGAAPLRFWADTDAFVPTPASLALFGAGLLVLVGIRRRRAL